MRVCYKQKTADERRSSDWSSDVCSSDRVGGDRLLGQRGLLRLRRLDRRGRRPDPELALADHGVQTRDVALDRTDAAVALELAGGRLEAQVEQLFLGLAQLLHETGVFERVELAGSERLGR